MTLRCLPSGAVDPLIIHLSDDDDNEEENRIIKKRSISGERLTPLNSSQIFRCALHNRNVCAICINYQRSDAYLVVVGERYRLRQH